MPPQRSCVLGGWNWGPSTHSPGTTTQRASLHRYWCTKSQTLAALCCSIIIIGAIPVGLSGSCQSQISLHPLLPPPLLLHTLLQGIYRPEELPFRSYVWNGPQTSLLPHKCWQGVPLCWWSVHGWGWPARKPSAKAWWVKLFRYAITDMQLELQHYNMKGWWVKGHCND